MFHIMFLHLINTGIQHEFTMETCVPLEPGLGVGTRLTYHSDLVLQLRDLVPIDGGALPDALQLALRALQLRLQHRLLLLQLRQLLTASSHVDER